MIAGEIIAKDDSSMTIKLNDGGSKIVLISGSTKTTKQADATADDLAVGTKVSVLGTTNSDGSVSAQSVQIITGAAMPGSPEGAAPQGSGSQPPAAN